MESHVRVHIDTEIDSALNKAYQTEWHRLVVIHQAVCVDWTS